MSYQCLAEGCPANHVSKHEICTVSSNQIVDWRALCLKVRDAVAAEGEAMRFSSGVGAARRKLAAVWEEVAQAERLSDETTPRHQQSSYVLEQIMNNSTDPWARGVARTCLMSSSVEPKTEQPCPVPQADGMSVQGRELAPGVWGIGEVHWHATTGDWRCLADVNGALCVIQVRVTPEKASDDPWTEERKNCTCPKPGTSNSQIDPMCPISFPHPWARPENGGDQHGS